MVTLLGFLQPPEVLIEFLLREPRCAIQALQHGTMLVATPIGTRHAHQFKRADLASVLYKRAGTQVKEVVLPADRDLGRPVTSFLHTAEFRKVVLLLVGADFIPILHTFVRLDFLGLSFTA